MKAQRSYRATALLGLVLATVIAAVFVFGEPTQHPPGRSPMALPAAPGSAAGAANNAAASKASTQSGNEWFAGIDVQLSRVGSAAEPERLPAYAEVRAGDRLRLGISSDRELYVYAFNQIKGAAISGMFPLPLLDTKNPLGPGEHELPGTINGAHQSYTVEASAADEEVLVVLAELPLPALEARLSALTALTAPAASAADSAVSLDDIVREAGPSVAIHRWVLRHLD